MTEMGKTFEIDGPEFTCVVCEKTVEFEFESDEGPIETKEMPEELEDELGGDMPTPENFAEEAEDFEDEAQEKSMKTECECGAEYLIKKVPGVPGFEVVHLAEAEPELVEKEFRSQI